MAAIHDAKVALGPTADSPCRVEEALGRFSSHPRWSAYQLRLWYLIAFAPLFAGAWVFGRYVLSDADAAVTMLVDYGRPLLLYGAAAAGFAAGLSLTAAIATQARRCRRIVDDAGAPAWIFVAAISAMVMIALSMLVLSLSLDLPPRARSLVTCLGILPLVMIQSLLQVTIRAEGSDGRPVTGKFKPWTAILPAIPVAFVLASQVEAVSRRLGSIDFVQRVIDMVGGGLPGVDPDVLRRWVVTVLVGSLASPFVAWATAMMMRLWRSDDSAEAGERPQDGTAVFPLLGERLPLAASIESAGAAEQGAGSEPASDPEPERLREEFVRDPLVVSLLGGHAPWPGQAEHVQGIVDAARRSRRQDPDAPPWERASMDFIVEGESGSGRTAAVVAAVLHGVICEGDRAIFFVPDEPGVEALEKRVRVALAAIGLDALMSVETLTPESVARWMGPSSGVATPAVMIGTPLQFERAFFEGTSTPERRGEVLRRIGMVIVEDLEAYGFDELVHLPFILHKFRLFLAATGDTCRTVVVTLPLTPAGRSLVRGRLCDARRAAPRTAVGGSASAPPASPAAAPRVVPFASRASTPLFVQHVCSVARLLPRRHPIHRSWWNACGLPEDRQLRSGAIAEPGDGMEILSDREVVLDPRIRHGLPPDDAVVHNAAAPTWPWAVADGPDAAPRPLPVGIGEPIDAGAGYLLDEDGLRLTPVISIPRPDGRIAVIRDQAMVLGRIDLAYMTRMVWRSLGTRYTFRRIFTDGDSTTIEGVPEMEREPGPDHAILGLPGIEWPAGVVAEDCGLSTGPCRGRISMYTIGQGAAPSATRWSFTGRYDDRGRIVHISPQVEYSCESSVFVLLLEAPADRRDAATVGKDVLEAWRLVGDHATPTHVPELGAAVAAALASLARGLERFARCIGLRLPGGHDAAARYAVLFVEPETTAGSARECLLEMLMDRGSAARFLQEVAAALAAESAGAGVPFVRSDYAVAPNVSGAAIAADAATVSALRALIASLATEVA